MSSGVDVGKSGTKTSTAGSMAGHELVQEPVLEQEGWAGGPGLYRKTVKCWEGS